MADESAQRRRALATFTREVVAKAHREMELPRFVPATMRALSGGTTAIIHVDGDPPDRVVPADLLVPPPRVSGRVMVVFGAGGSCYVVGNVAGTTAGTPMHGARVRRSTAFTVASGFPGLEIPMDVKDDDTDGYWSSTTNPQRLTVPAGLGGFYMVVGAWRTDGDECASPLVVIRKNGVARFRNFPARKTGQTFIDQTVCGPLRLADGDHVALVAYHETGRDVTFDPVAATAIDVDGPYLEMWRIGAL